MKRLVLLLLPLVAACTGDPINPQQYNVAFDLCKPHGGLKWVSRVEAYSTYDKIRVECSNNDMVTYINVPRPVVTPPSPPASGASAS